MIILPLLSVLPVNADSGDRFLEQVTPYLTSEGLRKTGEIQIACQADRYCMAQHLLPHIKGPAEIRKTVPPSTDSIRRARNLPSISRTAVLAASHLYISLDRFGRNAASSILSLCRHQRQWWLITLDLRKNQGGDPMRMLKIAALFSPSAEKVFYVKAPGKDKTQYSIADVNERCHFRKLQLLIGTETASSAELLASLMKTHAGARLLGATTYGKNFLYRLIPLNHDWRMYMPAEKIVLPGKDIGAGIAADKPIPVALLKQLDF